MHKAIAGCETMYFGMSVSDTYLAATVNAAAVAKHHGVKAFINMSQMTLSQMSITETTASPQHKLHWLAEQALNWSGLPVVHVRPTVFLEGLFLIMTADSVRKSNQIRLPFGEGKTDQDVRDLANYVLSLSGRTHDSLRAYFGKPGFAPCAACHGADGKGNPALGAPNLTDGVWLHGDSIEDIMKTIRGGRSGMMPAFRSRLGEDNASLVAAWVYAQSHPAR